MEGGREGRGPTLRIWSPPSLLSALGLPNAGCRPAVSHKQALVRNAPLPSPPQDENLHCNAALGGSRDIGVSSTLLHIKITHKGV